MAKQRNDYENSWYPRLLKWLEGGSSRLSQDMEAELVEESKLHHHVSAEEIEAREMEIETHRQMVEEHEKAIYDRMHDWSRTRGA